MSYRNSVIRTLSFVDSGSLLRFSKRGVEGLSELFLWKIYFPVFQKRVKSPCEVENQEPRGERGD